MSRLYYEFLVIVLLFTIQQFGVYAEIPEPQEPTINPQYIDYLNSKSAIVKLDVDGASKNFGYIPIPYPKNTGISKNQKKEGTLSTPPASFDLRTEGYTTSARNQGNCGSCWAFASLGSVESNWLMNNDGEFDLSENNMKNCHTFLWSPCDGGNSEIASSYLTSKGIISENNDPYRDYSQTCSSSVNPLAFVTNLYYLPNRSNSGYAEVLKNMIMNYGGVFSSLTWSERFYNSSARTYRYTGSASQNHAVMIVGWNDNLRITVNGRTSTGAWIAKNSWGTSWGDNGFFYIAYDDTRINGETAIWIHKEDANSIEKLYYYDEIGAVRQIGFSSTTGYGLVKFTATGNQTISKIGTWINSSNSTVSIEVYRSFQNNTLSNLLASISNLSCEYPGYYTFDLDEPISVNTNTDFYIKIQYTTPNYRYPIPIERSISGYCSPTIETGKCWISNNGRSWLQTGSSTRYPYDVCIRAYATQYSSTSIEVVTLEPQEISSNSAVLGGNVTANRIEVLSKGVCWSQNTNPTIRNNRTTNGSGTGSFSTSLNNLNQGTTYYFRAYAIISGDTLYGEESNFTTLSLPNVSSAEVSNITSNSANLSARVINDGNARVTERGVCYSTTQNPDISTNKLTSGTGTGSFSINLTNLRPGQTYYVKSFATNSVGTAYGEQISFTTNTVPPTVTTGNYSNVTTNSATVTGNVSDDGGSNVSERGVCYSTNQNPDYNSSRVQAGSGLGDFSCSLTNLNSGTTYYAKAYAVNNNGISYGSLISFTTEQEQQNDDDLTPPTNQDYNLVLSNVTSNSVQLDWSRGNGEGSFVVIRQANPISSSEFPQANTTYSSYNSNFSQAPSIGNGKIAFFGNGNSLRITGLNAITRYYIRIFAYNGNPSSGTAVFNVESETNNPITFRTARFKSPFLENYSESSFNLDRIYPNPSDDKICLDLSIIEATNLNIELYDLLGNLMIAKNLYLTVLGKNNISINSEAIPSGYYILIISNGVDTIIENVLVSH